MIFGHFDDELHPRILKTNFHFFFSIEEVLTKDSVTVSVDAVVYYRVSIICSATFFYQNSYEKLFEKKNLHQIESTKNVEKFSM